MTEPMQDPREVQVSKARAQLTEIVAAAKHDQDTLLTENGQPVAAVISIAAFRTMRDKEKAQLLAELRRRQTAANRGDVQLLTDAEAAERLGASL